MNIDEWWPKLSPSTQAWLIENNGDALTAGVVVEISAAGGSPSSDDDSNPVLSDADTDWIESIANGEAPEL